VLRVAVPVIRGKRRFHLLKGRPWSPVEHLVLQSLAKMPRTAADLSTASNLPRRVVIEMLIRLMRVGWVELSQQPDGALFRATTAGVIRAKEEELPSALRSMTRWMSFFVDRVTGTPFRGREFQAFPKAKLEERSKQEKIVWLAPDDDKQDIEPREFLTSLTEEDEQIIGIDPSHERLSELYALVTVRNGTIEGLPTRAPQALTQAILSAANSVKPLAPTEPRNATASHVFKVTAEGRAPHIVSAVFSQDDMILGGEAHREALHESIRKAKTRLIIHSTFVAAERLNALLPLLRNAALRGVRIDLLWGQADNTEDFKTTLELMRRAREQMVAASLDGAIQIHLHSTHSHAKLIVADDLTGGMYSAIVGSCNWLSSGFDSFDASTRSRDPQIVSDVLQTLAKLSRGSDGHWVPLTTDLAHLSAAVAKQNKPAGIKVRAALVLGAEHGHFVREARDSAKSRIFVTSHRLSEVGNRAIVLPALTAAQDERGIEPRLYFNRTSGMMTTSAASDLVVAAGKGKVRLRPVHDPRLHAKILAWDDDAVVVTSLNWLSADSSPNQPLQEVGLFIDGGRAADLVIQTFDNQHIA